MLKLAVQFENHSGPNAMGEHKIKFVIQKEFTELLYPVLQKLEKSPQVIMYLDLMESQEQSNIILNENDNEKWKRQNKHIHSLFDQVAEVEGIEGKDYKRRVKDKLIKKGKIQRSLKELSTDQQTDLIGVLENILTNKKFHE